MFKLNLEKTEEGEIKLLTSIGSLKKQESSRKTSASVLSTMPKLCVDHNKLWKIIQEMGISDHLTCLLRNLYTGQEATVRTVRTGAIYWLQIGKEYIKAVYCHPAYLTCMQSTSCETLD